MGIAELALVASRASKRSAAMFMILSAGLNRNIVSRGSAPRGCKKGPLFFQGLGTIAFPRVRRHSRVMTESRRHHHFAVSRRFGQDLVPAREADQQKETVRQVVALVKVFHHTAIMGSTHEKVC